MRVGNRKVLGLAFDERSVVVAEVRLVRGERRVQRSGEFAFPEGVSWQDPQRLGKALGQFLRQQRFAANRAVVGLPAKWLMAREVNVPPAAPAATAGVVRLQAEREFSPDPSELGLDYADVLDSRQARPVFLVAALRERLNQVEAVADAARLKVLAVTSSALAVSAAGKAPVACGITLVLRPGTSDLVARAGGHFCAVRHVAMPEPSAGGPADDAAALVGALQTEVRRALAAVARTHGPEGEAELTLWDGIGLPSDTLTRICGELGLEARVHSELPEIGLQPARTGEPPVAARFISAAALGVSALNGHRPQIDLLHSRLAPPAKKVFGRRATLATVAAVAVVAIAAALFIGWRRDVASVGALQKQYDKLKPDYDAAEDLVSKMNYARGWYEGRPNVLECLRGVTLSLPTAGRLWITDVIIKPAAPESRTAAAHASSAKLAAEKKLLSVSLRGTATDEQPVLDLRDRLLKNGFSVQGPPSWSVRNGRNGREVQFFMNLNFAGAE